ncbi:hypothetical protein SAMN05444682_101615 [Parapedobacter indicus]|uniref:Uncharacterized protein n=1 Tax=Parapedobacter indicus TaxID=1477437 RepID=A0A1I3DS87_9SPHI|nr:hypothetical protein CLV26_101629 [Parapedobacter indicus]SFH89595.1 hypothetical protein SAMN05444682_101615 [Parapedobacter indicus]
MDVRRPAAVMVRFAGEKGSCDLFPTLVRPFPSGVWLFRGKLVFVGTAEVRALYVQKHNLHNTKQKSGVIPQRAKKWVRGRVFGT